MRTLKVIRRIQPADLQPRGIAVTLDGKYIVTANKNTSDIAVFTTPRLRLLKRIQIGHSPEFIKVDPPATGFLLRKSQKAPPTTKCWLRALDEKRVLITEDHDFGELV